MTSWEEIRPHVERGFKAIRAKRATEAREARERAKAGRYAPRRLRRIWRRRVLVTLSGYTAGEHQPELRAELISAVEMADFDKHADPATTSIVIVRIFLVMLLTLVFGWLTGTV